MGVWSWAFWLGAGVAAAIALWVFWRALLADKARGRRRCPKCWYDLAGVPGLRCPECGKEAGREKHLSRTRRRWRMALGACVLLGVAAGLGLTPRVVEKGWDAIPIWALVVVQECTDSSGVELALQGRTYGAGNRWWPDRVAMLWRARRLLNDPDTLIASVGPWGPTQKLDMAIWTYGALGNSAAGDVERLLAGVRGREKQTDLWGVRSALTAIATEPKPIDAVVELVASDPSPSIRELAPGIIEEGDPARWIALLGKLLNDPEQFVRRRAIDVLPLACLRAQCVPPGVSGLALSATYPDSVELTQKLGKVGGLAAPTLGEILQNGSVGMRRHAAVALRQMESAARPAFGIIVEHGKNDPSAVVRRECVWALGMCGRVEDQVDVVIGEIATSDADELVRAAAFDAMAWEIVKVRYVGYAERGLGDKSVFVRRSAAKVLLLVGEGTEETVAALKTAANDEDAKVARNARAALEVLEARQDKKSE